MAAARTGRPDTRYLGRGLGPSAAPVREGLAARAAQAKGRTHAVALRHSAGTAAYLKNAQPSIIADMLRGWLTSYVALAGKFDNAMAQGVVHAKLKKALRAYANKVSKATFVAFISGLPEEHRSVLKKVRA